MDQSMSNKTESKEGLKSTPEQKQSPTEAKNLGGIDTSSILETVESGEDGVEFGVGKVSEKATEGIGEQWEKTSGQFQQFQKKLTDEEAKALKAKLLKSPPRTEEMVREIKRHVHEQIQALQSKSKTHEKTGNFKELSNVVMKIRQLKEILRELLQATAEVIKNLWLKVVHGIV